MEQKKTYLQPAQELPVLYDVDVLVVGGGTAGVTAAVAAARAGAKTLVIERMGTLGGTPTTNLMASCGNSFYNRDGQRLIRGLPLELMERLAKLGGTHLGNAEASIRGKMDIAVTVPTNPVLLSLAMWEMAREAGVQVLVHTVFSHVIEPGPHPKGIVAVNKSGPFAIFAKEIVDCSGNADVAIACGAPLSTEKKEAEGQQRFSTSWSLLMRMGNVNFDRVIDHFRAYDPAERWPEFRDWLAAYLGKTWEEVDDGYWTKMLDPIQFSHAPNATPDGHAYSEEKKQYMLERWEKEHVLYDYELSLLRRELKAAVDAGDFQLYKHIPGVGTLKPIWDGFAIGAWGEGVALVNICGCWEGFDPTRGDDVSRAEEECRKYNHEIANFLIKYVPGFENAFLLDMGAQTVDRSAVMIDGVVRGGGALMGTEKRPLGDGVFWYGGYRRYGPPVPIPYGVGLPRGVENLFVAGKHASGGVHYRGIVSCMAMGQAMGAAAALCARLGTANTALDVALLQDELRRQDVLLDLED